MIYDAAVVIPTVFRPELRPAVRSVFAQNLDGTVQILVGIDKAEESREIAENLRGECPDNMALTVLDHGYSTTRINGGFYFLNWSGGALRTIMSYAANAFHFAYLDDDNWWAPSHLSDLKAAIEGADWALSRHWYVDPTDAEPVWIDEWESVGPGRGEDKSVFKRLTARHPWAETGKATALFIFRDQRQRQRVERLMKSRTDFTEPPECSYSTQADPTDLPLEPTHQTQVGERIIAVPPQS